MVGAPGVELGRAMDAPCQVSESESPEGERPLRPVERSEERGEKPKEEVDADESAALESDERSLTGPE